MVEYDRVQDGIVEYNIEECSYIVRNSAVQCMIEGEKEVCIAQ